MIDKALPKKLDVSKDARLREKDTMFAAINVNVDNDFTSGDNGDVGVIKPKSGNSEVTTGFKFPASEEHQRRVIGSVSDNRLGIIYYFVYSTNANEQGVYAFDKDDALGTGVYGNKEIFTSSLFNFPSNGFVDADVVHSSSFKKGVIYFTDNVNEPRRLDVHRAITEGSQYTTNSNQNAVDTKDFITACPKTPIHPITFFFDQDTTRQFTDFEGSIGFQFAYQCIYKSGEESAISTYSDIAVPPSYVNQGTSPSNSLISHNRCVLSIPRIVNGIKVYTKEVEKIRILARIGGEGIFYVVDEIDAASSGDENTYNFYNDKVLYAIPEEDQQKQFDSLPRKARTQAVLNNRLFYANYVEGYNNIDESGQPVFASADFSLVHRDRPTDFITLNVTAEPVVLATGVDYDQDGISTNLSYTPNRRVGYKLDMSNVQEQIDSGTILNVSLSIAPDKNFHIYNTEGQSHHLSQTVFGRPATTGSIDETSGHLTTDRLFMGGNSGVSDSILHVKDPGTAVTGSECVIGTSASNPLIISRLGVSFSCSIEFNQDINSDTRVKVRDAVVAALTGGDMPQYATLLSASVLPSLTQDVPMSEGEDEILATTGTDFRKDLICAAAPVGITYNSLPLNYFIVKEANITFKLESDFGPTSMDGEEENGFVRLAIDSLDIVDVRTCVPEITVENGVALPSIKKWKVYSKEYLTQNNISGSTDNPFFYYDEQLGIASYPYGNPTLTYRLDVANSIIDDVQNFSIGSNYSIVDGESYHANRTFSEYELQSSQEGQYVYLTSFTIEQGSINFNNILLARVDTRAIIGAINGYTYEVNQPILSTSATTGWSVNGYVDPDTIINNPSQIEILSFNGFFTEPGIGGFIRSFKTKANHEFGIVYYDERGRSGPVMPLGTVYVPGYSDAERGPSKGRVEILATINNNPPVWAHSYQIVYAGNTSVSDFVQYTAGGAFVTEGDNENGNIYVSLNYLQNNETASYVHGYGAVNNEGGDEMYVYKSGDKLRIISYYIDEDTRLFPQNIEFDIVGTTVFSDSVDENPFYIDGEDSDSDNTVPKAKTGQFLILRNNPTANGFSYSDVAGGNFVNSNSNRWNNRCLFEIYSPSQKVNKESVAYYEVSDVFNVVKNTITNQLTHQTNSILLRRGDVWWRKAAVNMPNYNSNGNFFENIIMNGSSEGNFRDYYIESKAFTDKIPGAEIKNRGKLKLVDYRAKEVRRDSSITYSDFNNYASSLVRFTSFNAAKLPYKDTPNEYGSITRILNISDSIFCIQENKCSALPVERDIISTASGTESLITTNEVIGSQRFYSGDYGCEDHPESVIMVGNNIYFASVAQKEVYRFNPSNGIYPISETGMKSYFRKAFKNSPNRVVSGYDPINDEYLLSWYTWYTLSLIGSYILDHIQDESTQIIDESESIGDGVVITGGGGTTGGGDGGSGGGGTDTGGGGGSPGAGYNEGYTAGFNEGYSDGLDDGEDAAEEAILSAFEEALDGLIDTTGDPWDTIEEAIDDITTRIDNDNEYILSVPGLIEDAVTNATTPLNDQISALQDQVSGLQDDLSLLQAAFDASTGDVSDLLNEIGGLEAEIRKLNGQIDYLEGVVEFQKGQIQTLQNDLFQVTNERDEYIILYNNSQSSLAALQVDFDQYVLYAERQFDNFERQLEAQNADAESIVNGVAIDLSALLFDAILQVTDQNGRPILEARDFPQPLQSFLTNYQNGNPMSDLLVQYLSNAPLVTKDFTDQIKKSINDVIQLLYNELQAALSGGDSLGGGGVQGGGGTTGGDGDSGGDGVTGAAKSIPVVFDPNTTLTVDEIRTALLNVLVHSPTTDPNFDESGIDVTQYGGSQNETRYIGSGAETVRLEEDEDGSLYFIDESGTRFNVSGPNYFEFIFDSDLDYAVDVQDLLNLFLAYGATYDFDINEPTIIQA